MIILNIAHSFSHINLQIIIVDHYRKIVKKTQRLQITRKKKPNNIFHSWYNLVIDYT
ncbi:hypothetical protein HanRHA438_Chr14g0642581 [Helianthus annuus]|uniref:Uncharacterized protein n=1 Tax=Helianthus annuus TaxID=4232 RepID=A0A9K3H598_HELAN|nr:hypothetical protein HanXRQr2_Chr14g0631581 [Helianthus annuus]KAJ0467450.1 hypothetical protein HanIR_Chr14g0685371 [Helianthus annuus]KAJ0839356.1 hypothetical protein HanPSC8_Chr14g0605871 [Helianthus annuus]KAJ0852691.1 hypothetical protein HanRHA438_Chr14g0642581 [Helianthus annuus]